MASSRFPLDQAPDSSAKAVMEEALIKMHGGKPPPFQWTEDDGRSLVGCYAPLSYTPIIAKQFFETAKTIYGIVDPRIRELAILGLSSVLEVPYVVYCHREIAPKVGISRDQYDDGLGGKVPRGLSAKEDMAYRLGRILTRLTGPLEEDVWQDVILTMDKVEFMGIVHTVAGYRWVSLLEQVEKEFKQ